jgi:general nucleoside transport system permease protein
MRPSPFRQRLDFNRSGIARSLVTAFAALFVFALLLAAAGKSPLKAYADTLTYVFGNAYGFSELLVRMVPLLFTATAVALPARIGLINVGGEGQLLMGALFATGGAISFPEQPSWISLPLTTVLGFLGGALCAMIPGVLRAARLVNETISTLLLNYIAPLIVSYLIFGPWRSAESAAYPESARFSDAARLPVFFHTRIHAGLFYAIACLALYWFLVGKSRWGLDMRAIGGNAEAARRLGIPVFAYTVAVMGLAGGVAGLAGMVEVSAIQGRLVMGLSPGYGFAGFLVAWLAGTSAVAIAFMSLLFAIIGSAGDILQFTQGLPYAVINVLMALILFIVLSQRSSSRPAR